MPSMIIDELKPLISQYNLLSFMDSIIPNLTNEDEFQEQLLSTGQELVRIEQFQKGLALFLEQEKTLKQQLLTKARELSSGAEQQLNNLLTPYERAIEGIKTELESYIDNVSNPYNQQYQTYQHIQLCVKHLIAWKQDIKEKLEALLEKDALLTATAPKNNTYSFWQTSLPSNITLQIFDHFDLKNLNAVARVAKIPQTFVVTHLWKNYILPEKNSDYGFWQVLLLHPSEAALSRYVRDFYGLTNFTMKNLKYLFFYNGNINADGYEEYQNLAIGLQTLFTKAAALHEHYPDLVLLSLLNIDLAGLPINRTHLVTFYQCLVQLIRDAKQIEQCFDCYILRAIKSRIPLTSQFLPVSPEIRKQFQTDTGTSPLALLKDAAFAKRLERQTLIQFIDEYPPAAKVIFSEPDLAFQLRKLTPEDILDYAIDKKTGAALLSRLTIVLEAHCKNPVFSQEKLTKEMIQELALSSPEAKDKIFRDSILWDRITNCQVENIDSFHEKIKMHYDTILYPSTRVNGQVYWMYRKYVPEAFENFSQKNTENNLNVFIQFYKNLVDAQTKKHELQQKADLIAPTLQPDSVANQYGLRAVKISNTALNRQRNEFQEIDTYYQHVLVQITNFVITQHPLSMFLDVLNIKVRGDIKPKISTLNKFDPTLKNYKENLTKLFQDEVHDVTTTIQDLLGSLALVQKTITTLPLDKTIYQKEYIQKNIEEMKKTLQDLLPQCIDKVAENFIEYFKKQSAIQCSQQDEKQNLFSNLNLIVKNYSDNIKDINASLIFLETLSSAELVQASYKFQSLKNYLDTECKKLEALEKQLPEIIEKECLEKQPILWGIEIEKERQNIAAISTTLRKMKLGSPQEEKLKLCNNNIAQLPRLMNVNEQLELLEKHLLDKTSDYAHPPIKTLIDTKKQAWEKYQQELEDVITLLNQKEKLFSDDQELSNTQYSQSPQAQPVRSYLLKSEVTEEDIEIIINSIPVTKISAIIQTLQTERNVEKTPRFSTTSLQDALNLYKNVYDTEALNLMKTQRTLQITLIAITTLLVLPLGLGLLCYWFKALKTLGKEIQALEEEIPQLQKELYEKLYKEILPYPTKTDLDKEQQLNKQNTVNITSLVDTNNNDDNHNNADSRNHCKL